jgi:hypothetical protein
MIKQMDKEAAEQAKAIAANPALDPNAQPQ